MENNRITHQYEPGFLHNIVELESLDAREETIETPEIALEPAPEDQAEMVDFYITPDAVNSLKGIVKWSEVLVASMILFAVIELLLMAVLMLYEVKFISLFLPVLRSLASLGIYVWLIIQAVKFNRKMNQAIQYNDNTALADAFSHQAAYFKWVWYSILVTIVFSVLKLF